jgi:hypothetical protein
LEIREGAKRPHRLFKRLAHGNDYASKVFLIAKIKTIAHHLLDSEGLEWDEVKTTVEEQYTVAQLRKGCRKPSSFLKDLLAGKSGLFHRSPQLLHTATIRKLRPKLETELKNGGFSWEVMLPVIQKMKRKDIVRVSLRFVVLLFLS